MSHLSGWLCSVTDDQLGIAYFFIYAVAILLAFSKKDFRRDAASAMAFQDPLGIKLLCRHYKRFLVLALVLILLAILMILKRKCGT